jgi:hypothetical protein
MDVIGSKAGRGGYSVAFDGARIVVDVAGHGESSFDCWQAAADHCRHVMALHGAAPTSGELPYFGAANALGDILETGEAE